MISLRRCVENDLQLLPLYLFLHFIYFSTASGKESFSDVWVWWRLALAAIWIGLSSKVFTITIPLISETLKKIYVLWFSRHFAYTNKNNCCLLCTMRRSDAFVPASSLSAGYTAPVWFGHSLWKQVLLCINLSSSSSTMGVW